MDFSALQQQQEVKETTKPDLFPLLSRTLTNFRSIDTNGDYIKLTNQLVDFKQKQKDNIYLKTEIPFESMKTKLYTDLEASLTEIVLINNPQVRNENLRKLHLWFDYTLKYFESLIHIKMRTQQDKNQFIEQEQPVLDEELTVEEMKLHRCDIAGFEAPNIRLKEFERKEVSVPLHGHQMNMTETSSFRKTEDKFKRINSGKSTNIKTTCYATQTGSRFFKPNTNISNGINDEKRAINTTSIGWFNPLKEIKSSYSVMRPEYKYPHIVLEKEITDNKMKAVGEKRHADEVYDNLQEFSLKKAAYTQMVNKKHEMKDLIKKYKVIVELNAKKEEEERIRLAKEKRLKEMIEKENERKKKKEEEEKKRKEEEEASTTKEKSSANNYNPKELSNEIEQHKMYEKENQKYYNDINENEEENEGEDNEEGEEEDKEEEEQAKVEEVVEKLKDKVNTYDVKYICSSSKNNNEKVISVQCKISRDIIRKKNNNEMLQRKIVERQNALLEMNQQIQITLPSDLISYTTSTTNKVTSLRTFNSKILNIKQIDTLKDTYQKSLCPLSMYDQIHMLKTDPTEKKNPSSETFAFLYNSYQKNSHDFLNFRLTLSTFRENNYNLIKNESKQTKNMKIKMKNSFCNPYKTRSHTPLTYLPISNSNLLHFPSK